MELGREHDDQEFSVPPVELGAVNTHSNWWSVDMELGSEHTFSMELVTTYYSILSGNWQTTPILSAQRNWMVRKNIHDDHDT